MVKEEGEGGGEEGEEEEGETTQVRWNTTTQEERERDLERGTAKSETFSISVKSVPLEAAFEPQLGATTPKHSPAIPSSFQEALKSSNDSPSSHKHALVEMKPVHRGSWAPRVAILKQTSTSTSRAIEVSQKLFRKGTSPEAILSDTVDCYPPSSHDLSKALRAHTISHTQQPPVLPSHPQPSGDPLPPPHEMIPTSTTGALSSNSSSEDNRDKLKKKKEPNFIERMENSFTSPVKEVREELAITQLEPDKASGIARSGKGAVYRVGGSDILAPDIVLEEQPTISLEDVPSGASACEVNMRLDSKEHPLLAAIFEGNTAKALKLISKLNGKKLGEIRESINHFNPLIIASHFGYEDVVTQLILKGMPLDKRSRDGLTALCHAAMNRHENIMKILIENGADLNKRGPSGTALSYAILAGSYSTAKLLLDKGAYPNIYDKKGWTPLMVAISFGMPDIIPDLLGVSDIDHRNKSGKTALMVAAIYGQCHCAHELLKRGAAIDQEDTRGWTALMYAIEHGHHLSNTHEHMRRSVYISRKGVKSTTPRHTPLASIPSPESKKKSKKSWFSRKKEEKPVVAKAEVIDHSDDITLDESITEEDVQRIVTDERLRTVAYFLRSGSNPLHKSQRNGWTPIMVAAALGLAAVVYRLIECGCELTDRLAGGHTILTLALTAVRPSVDTVQLLLDNGVDPNEPGEGGILPLMYAAIKDQSLVAVLIEHGAIVNAVADVEGSVTNALFCAIEKGNVALVQDLIKNGADVNYVSKTGVTAQSLANDRLDMQHFFNWLFGEGKDKDVYDYIQPDNLRNIKPFKILVQKTNKVMI